MVELVREGAGTHQHRLLAVALQHLDDGVGVEGAGLLDRLRPHLEDHVAGEGVLVVHRLAELGLILLEELLHRRARIVAVDRRLLRHEVAGEAGHRFLPVDAGHRAATTDGRVNASGADLLDRARPAGDVAAVLDDVGLLGQRPDAVDLRLDAGILVLVHVVADDLAAEHFAPHPIEAVADALVVLEHVVEQEVGRPPALHRVAPLGDRGTLHRGEDRA